LGAGSPRLLRSAEEHAMRMTAAFPLLTTAGGDAPDCPRSGATLEMKARSVLGVAWLLGILSALPQVAHGQATCSGGLCCSAWQVEQFRNGKPWAHITKPTYESLEEAIESSKKTDRQLCNYFHGSDCGVTYSNPVCATSASSRPSSGQPSCPGYRGTIPAGARACGSGETPAVVDFYGKNLSCAWCY
jgi:hypothetical protein